MDLYTLIIHKAKWAKMLIRSAVDKLKLILSKLTQQD